MRILSLTSSSSGCERNWSTFEGVHTKKRNRLSAKLLNNPVFIQFNARLLSKQKREQDKNDIDVLSSYDATKVQEWIVDMIVDDDNEDGELRTSKYRTMRELYDDFDSEDKDCTDLDEVDGDEVLGDTNV